MSTSTDYIPTADADFLAWLKNFVDFANTNLATLGLVAADLTPLQTANTAWETAYAANIAAQAAAQSTRQVKDDAKAEAEFLVRPLVRRLQTSPVVKDAQREALQITVRATTRTASAVPESRPTVTVDTRQRLRHTISFVDELTPTTRAKPAGVFGCEIWVKIGGVAPADPAELSYLATVTKTPYIAEYNGQDGGKIAYYMVRWVNTRVERGPWSQTVMATITA